MKGMMRLTALLAGASALTSGYLCWRLVRRERHSRDEAKVEEAMEAAADEEEERRSREMTDGFDNLMRFSVNGQDGFGGAL